MQPGLPVPSEIELDLSEGPHLGYAGQWFMFAFILAVGYPVYVYRQETARAKGPVGSQPVPRNRYKDEENGQNTSQPPTNPAE